MVDGSAPSALRMVCAKPCLLAAVPAMAGLSVLARLTRASELDRDQAERDPTYSPSNKKTGNKCGNFYISRCRGLNLGQRKILLTHCITETNVWLRGHASTCTEQMRNGGKVQHKDQLKAQSGPIRTSIPSSVVIVSKIVQERKVDIPMSPVGGEAEVNCGIADFRFVPIGDIRRLFETPTIARCLSPRRIVPENQLCRDRPGNSLNRMEFCIGWPIPKFLRK